MHSNTHTHTHTDTTNIQQGLFKDNPDEWKELQMKRKEEEVEIQTSAVHKTENKHTCR